MAALDELLALEQEISDIGKGLLEASARLRVLEKDLIKAKGSYDAALAKVIHYKGLIRHMRTSADLVDLAEYAEAKRTLVTCIETQATASNELAHLQKEKTSITKTVERMEFVRSQRRASLATYGEVRQFPSHDAS